MMTLNELKKEALENNIPIIKDKTLDKILHFIESHNIQRILEIGSATGYSAINFAINNKNIKIYTIEKDYRRYEEAKTNISKFNLSDQIMIEHGDANLILNNEKFIVDYKKFLDSNKFDMIFIDAAKGQYIKFLKSGLKHLNVGSYIVADNILYKGYVLGEYKEKKHRTIVNNLRGFLEIVNNEENFETTIYKIDDGFSISKIKKM